MSMTFSVQDLDYLTALGPEALNDGPVAALELAWNVCLAGQVERPKRVRQVIWDSWRRSVEAGINPADNAYRFVTPDSLAATLATHRVLIAAAAQVMHGLLAYNPRGHINLTDADGTTLYFCGLDITPVGSRLLVWVVAYTWLAYRLSLKAQKLAGKHATARSHITGNGGRVPLTLDPLEIGRASL